MNQTLFHNSWYNLVSLGTLFTGLAFALLLAFAQRINRGANRFLGIALALCVMVLAGLPVPCLLALGPLLYFYVRKLTIPEWRINRKNSWHLFSLLLIVFIPGRLILFSVLAYLFLSHRLIKNYYTGLHPVLMDKPLFAFRRLGNELWLLSLLCMLWVFTSIAGIGFAVVLISMAAAELLKRDAIDLPQTPLTTPEGLRDKGRWLKGQVLSGRFYEDTDLTLASLAVKLMIHPHELSRIINLGLKKNFSDFINELRVKEVSRKMQNPAYNHLTLLGIAYESGFNSQRTFNRAFKEMTGKTPAAYKNSLKKELPIDKLATLSPIWPVILRSESQANGVLKKLKRNYMFKNYLKIAWRSLRRHQSYTTINITGLTVGIAACLLIFLVVQYETSFDNFHAKKDRICRVTGVVTKPSLGFQTGVPFPLPEALRLDFPQLPKIASILRNEGSLFSTDNKKFKEDETYYADPAFFQTFDFAWLAGEPKTALAEPNTVALTRSEADKFFGDWRKAMGKTIRYKNSTNLKVTGILENVPPNTDFPLKIVISYASMHIKGGENFGNMQNWGLVLGENYCFVVLPAGANVHNYEQQFDAFTNSHNPAAYKAGLRTRLQPLTAMHADSRLDIFTGQHFSKQLINAISLIGLFLVLIACVNFINLATAQAVNRSKEVGIRKVLGSRRKQLVLQFMSETGIITLSAILLALVLSWLALPFVNRLLDIRLDARFIMEPMVLTFLGLLWLAVTFLSGFYPAMVLSGFNPVSALKNKSKQVSSGGISLRRALVVIQFCIAQLLIIGILVMIAQLNYFKNKSLGFNKTAVLTIPLPGDSLSKTRMAFLRNELLQQPGVKGLSYSSYSPVDEDGWLSGIHFNHSAKETDFAVNLKWADADHFKLYQLQFLAGKPYAVSDTLSGYVVNETMVKKLGLASPQQAIGKMIGLWNNRHFNGPIVGVVRDYNIGSLKDAVPPVLMANQKSLYGTLNIKVGQADLKQTLGGIESKYNAAFPDALYEYHFIDEQVARFYKTDTQLSQLYQVFAGIAILISCLGLFGLVSFMAVQRTKEVGIRKTLGASVGHIVYLFSKEFTLLVLVAFAIAAPVGWYLMTQWLEAYTFRIKLGPGIFLLAILLSVIIAWLTVGYKALKAALANPVRSLRSE